MPLRFYLRIFTGVLLFFLAVFPLSAAAEIPASPQGYVSDYIGLLPDENRKNLEQMIGELSARISTELAVVVIASTAPDPIETYAVKLFDQWGIGKKGKDTGVLLLVAMEDRAVRIEVGYGLEGVLTDAHCAAIIHQVMIPLFKTGQPVSAIEQGVLNVIRILAKAGSLKPEAAVPGAVEQESGGEEFSLGLIIFLLFFFIILMVILQAGRRPFPGGDYDNSWSFGGGGFGGGFGSGFGGFGGGMSGGGGASGRW